MIVGLFLVVLGPGGVQAFGRHCGAILDRLACESGAECHLMSLRDPAGLHQVTVGEATLVVRGFGGDRLRFLAAVGRIAPRATLVYIGHPFLASLACVRVLRPRLAVWVAVHGIEVWAPLSLMRRRGLRLATGVTAVSEETAHNVAKHQGVAPENIKVIFNALDPEIARWAALPSGAPFQPTILTVGRLSASEGYKGVDDVIRALPAVLARIPDARYLVVGDGDDRPRLEDIAQRAGVAGRVHFVGVVDELDLVKSYRECAVFAMPSRGEGFGIVYIEAMAFGKPVIATRAGGAPEVVIDGETGFLTEPGDIPDIATRLVSLLDDQRLRERLGEAARRRVLENYTFELLGAALTEIFAVRSNTTIGGADITRATDQRTLGQ